MTEAPAPADRVAVVILTFNEELNLPRALASIASWAGEIFVLDSLSSDRTIEIAREYRCRVVQHRFEDYAKQRNFALTHLPITCEWVFFLDADEWLPDTLKAEISGLVATSPPENGFYVNRRLFWMGRWIRRGYYPCWILRLFRYGKGRCEDKPIDEHLIVEGATGRLQNDLLHEDSRGVNDWITKHNRYATLAAQQLLRKKHAEDYQEIEATLLGTQAQRRRWLRYRIWNRLPLLVRPFLYFHYRYVLRGGFLDGVPGFTFHFLQALWYPMLVDIKHLELLARQTNRPELPSTATPGLRPDVAQVSHRD